MQDKLPGDKPQAEVPKLEVNPTTAASTNTSPQSASPPKEPQTVKPAAVEVAKAEPPASPPKEPQTVKPAAVEVAKAEPTPTASTPEPEKVEIKVEEPGELPATSAENSSQDQWPQMLQQVTRVFDSSPSLFDDFFVKYKQPLISVALILLVLLGVKLLSGILDAINDIPLVEPTFQVIGIGYTGWFAYRYLLSAQNRQELSKLIQNVKEYVFGKGNSGT